MRDISLYLSTIPDYNQMLAGKNALKHFFQHLFVVIARAENRRNLLCKIDDSGFEADLGVSSVDDTVNFVPKILDHMLGFRRARPA